jgi:predicted phosphoribosyltransferase
LALSPLSPSSVDCPSAIAARHYLLIMRFTDRREAGRRLAAALGRYAGRPDVTVLALPRGGLPVGFEVAQALGAPLDVFVVRKLGVPGHEELAMGAIASGGALSINREVMSALEISERELSDIAEAEAAEVTWRERRYREGRPALDVRGRTVLVVDDGLATGSTMFAAILALRELGPSRIVVAVPVAPSQTLDEMESRADEVVCLETPDPFFSVGQFYWNFSQTSDEEVRSLLHAAGSTPVPPPGAPQP